MMGFLIGAVMSHQIGARTQEENLL